jgi:large subunit ribosomal protein L35
MPKLKTNRSVKKRMRVTKSGKVKHFKSGRGHLLTLKSSKRKRHLGKAGYLKGAEAKTVNMLLPYGA